MKCGKLLVLAVILLSHSLVNCGKNSRNKSRPCLAEQHEYYNRDSGCKNCDKCPLGTQPLINDQDIKHNASHGAITCYRCTECAPGTYNDKSSYDKCRRCETCAKLHRQTEKNCTTTSNAVCGQCLTGYHDIYKVLYNSSEPQRDRHCQSCKVAEKNAPECQDFHAKLVIVHSMTPGHESSTKKQPSTLTLLDKKSEEIKVNQAIQETNSNNEHGQSSIPYLLAILITMCLVLFLVVALKWKTIRCRHRARSVPESGDLEIGHKEGSYNTSFTTSNSTEYVSSPPRFIGETRRLLPTDVITDGEKDIGRENAVATRSDFCLVQKLIGREWKDLARLLEISEPDIEKHEMNHSDASERIFQLLFNWKKHQGEAANIGWLCKALKGVSRHDVAVKLMHNIGNLEFA